MERLQNFREDETGGRDREGYDDEQVDPASWMVSRLISECKRVERFEEYCK